MGSNQKTHKLTLISSKQAPSRQLLHYQAALIARKAMGLANKIKKRPLPADFKPILASTNQALHSAPSGRQRIVLLGPYHFTQPMWRVRAEVSMPDLIKPLAALGDACWISTIPDQQAIKSCLQLVNDNSIEHILLPPHFPWMAETTKIDLISQTLKAWNATHIMNSFGALTAGCDAMCAGHAAGIGRILRIPGDEDLSRVLMSNSSTSPQQQSDVESDHRLSRALAHAEEVVVMSQKEAERIKNVARSDSPIHIIPRGVDSKRFFPKSELKKAPKSNSFQIGYLGRLTGEKGVDLLAEIVDLLKEQAGVKFQIASPTPLPPDTLLHGRNVNFLGLVLPKNVPSFLRTLDCLILPSHTEGLSQSMLEAMATALPVIACNGVVDEDLPGVVLHERNAAAIAATISNLVQDKDRAEKLGKEAREAALSLFDNGDNNKKLQALFLNQPSDSK